MVGAIEFEVVERPAYLDMQGGKNKEIYTKVIKTLDVMKSTNCIKIPPTKVVGKTNTSKVINLRSGLSRAVKLLGKKYRPVVVYDEGEDMIMVWSRIIVK